MARKRKSAWDRVRSVIRSSSIVLEVLDARAPDATRCRKLEDYSRRIGKRLMMVINKSDLAGEGAAKSAKARLRDQFPCVFVSAKRCLGRGRVMAFLRQHAKEGTRVAVIGYPNVGKSSLINMLTHRGKARTSPEPGFTKGEQWIRLDENILLLDTPGVIPRDESVVDLALLGAWDIDKLRDPVPVAWILIKRLSVEHPEVIEHYGGDPSDPPETVLEEIARARGRLLKGGEPDINEMAKSLVRDWHRGRISGLLAKENGS